MKIGIEGPKTLKMNMIIEEKNLEDNYYCYGEACPLSPPLLDETLTFKESMYFCRHWAH